MRETASDKPGIIGPTQVAKKALQNAASIVGWMLTTEARVSEIKEKEKPPAGIPSGGGVGGIYQSPGKRETGNEAPARAPLLPIACLGRVPEQAAELIGRHRVPDAYTRVR